MTAPSERELGAHQDARGVRVTDEPAATMATCPDCGWTMPADDEFEAEVLLEVHRIVKLNDAYREGA